VDYATGKVFDSSWTGNGAGTVELGQTVVGFQLGVEGMRVGGRREIVVPPQDGYGSKGAGPVGPNETIIFVIDLLAAQ
jgi:peptidylprolyl isomerase